MKSVRTPASPTLTTAARALLLPELADSLPELLAYFDQNSYICQFANRRFADFYGYTGSSVAGMHARDIVGSLSWAFIEPYVERARAGTPQTYQREAPTSDDSVRILHVSLTPHINTDGQQGGVLVMVSDVTLRSDAERGQRENEVRQQKFAHVTQEAIAFHRRGIVLDCNDAMTRLTGYPVEEIRGSNILNFLPPSDRAKAKRFSEHPDEVLYEVSLMHRDGHLLSVEVLGMPLPSHGEDHRMVMVRDIRLRKSMQQHEMFLHDGLTELPNRRALMEQLETALCLARSNSQTCAVFAVDLDYFKTINDSLGHAAGDQLLREVAQRLSRCLGERGFVARTEGDGFVLVAPNLSLRSYEAMAQQVIEAVAQPTSVDGTSLVLSASVGVALFPQHASNAGALVRQAEAAQLLAKQNGRGKHQFSVPDLLPPPIELLRLEYELRAALQSGALLLHYQPVMQLANGRIAGVEALARWQHPTRGLLPPSAFINLAESHGLIAQIGRWVLHEACQQAKQWHDQGMSELCVAVNVSAMEFRQRDVAQEIAQALAETGLDAQFLEIELTESVLMHHSDTLMQSLHAIKAQGVRIAIDDFGTGYSSLAYLKRYPLDKLKIDRSFVMDTPHNAEDVAIVTAVLQLAHSLKLQTVAEGVTNEAQQQLFAQLGCDFCQGYWLARPMPADEATLWLQTRASPERAV